MATNPPGAKPAGTSARQCQHAARRRLPLADEQSFDDARRGFSADIVLMLGCLALVAWQLWLALALVQR